MKIKKLEWKDVTLVLFYQIQELIKEPDAFTMCNIIDLLYGTDSANMPITEFNEYKKATEFLKTEIKNRKKERYLIELNGTNYIFDFNLTLITTAQYIDFQNYCQRKPILYEDVLSVFVVPEGHIYNDGYDIGKVKKDLLQCPVDLIVTASFFFAMQLQLFIQIFPTCFKEEVMKMSLTTEQKKMIISEVDKVDWDNLVSFHTLAECVQSSMKAGQA